MALKIILSTLQTVVDDNQQAVKFGRIGFFHWLLEIPEGEDVAEHAKLAHAQASSLNNPGPSVVEFCLLLEKAAHSGSGTRFLTETKRTRKRLGGNRAIH